MLSTPHKWDFDDEESSETKNVFKKLFEDFREDTPQLIKDLFKQCVKQDPEKRCDFKTVNKYLSFMNHEILRSIFCELFLDF